MTNDIDKTKILEGGFYVPLKIFLCHASEDKSVVRKLYERLKQNFVPWLDAEDLLPGQDWQLEIEKAVHNSHIVIVCLSNKSITKSGYVQKEIKYALDVADKQPEGALFVIPLKLEECQVPERLSRWQWVNDFQADGYQKLMRALDVRAKELGLPSKPKKLEMLTIAVQVNEKYIIKVSLPSDLSTRQILDIIQARPEIVEAIGDKQIKGILYIPNCSMNFDAK